MIKNIVSLAAGLAAAVTIALLKNQRRQRKLEPREAATTAEVDLNSAEREELLALSGIGPALADRIIDHRPYRNKMDLLSQMVIPAKLYARLKHQLTVSRAAALQPVKLG